MTRWLLSVLLLLAVAGWTWLAHGILWGVPPGPIRIASTPWPCAEPLAFNRSLGDSADVDFIDLQTARQLARGLGNGAVDIAFVGLDDLGGAPFAGTPTRSLGMIECGSEVRAAVARPDASLRPGEVLAAAWQRGINAANAMPDRWHAHLQARRQPVPPVPRFVATPGAAPGQPIGPGAEGGQANP